MSEVLTQADNMLEEANQQLALDICSYALHKATAPEPEPELEAFSREIQSYGTRTVLTALREGKLSHQEIADNLAKEIKVLMDNFDGLKPKIKVSLIDPSRTDLIPAYAKPGDSGMDLRYSGLGMHLFPDRPAAVPTGVKIELPTGYEAQIRSKSGLATKGVFVTNSPGTVDNGYRGELFAILSYVGPETQFYIEKGMKVAQLVLAPISYARLEIVSELSDTERGEGKFGSTGN
jgi:dUTP pyrophosphatase